jgi:hypothetical protein
LGDTAGERQDYYCQLIHPEFTAEVGEFRAIDGYVTSYEDEETDAYLEFGLCSATFFPASRLVRICTGAACRPRLDTETFLARAFCRLVFDIRACGHGDRDWRDLRLGNSITFDGATQLEGTANRIDRWAVHEAWRWATAFIVTVFLDIVLTIAAFRVAHDAHHLLALAARNKGAIGQD